jgi:predicted transcriptional regulator
MDAARGQSIRDAARLVNLGNNVEQAAAQLGVTANEVKQYLDGGEAWLEPQLPGRQRETREKGPLSEKK